MTSNFSKIEIREKHADLYLSQSPKFFGGKEKSVCVLEKFIQDYCGRKRRRSYFKYSIEFFLSVLFLALAFRSFRK